MSSKVIVIGLDAADATLVKEWSKQRYLPNFSKLADIGRSYCMSNRMETLPGAIWPEITSGRSCGKVPLYYHPRQLHTGESMIRPVLAEEINPEDYYWAVASRAGRRSAVVDAPQTVQTPDFNGIQLFEWGLHDRNFATASDPPELLNEIREKYGDHPVVYCDRHGGKEQGYKQLFKDLQDGTRCKTKLIVDLLGREDWELFVCTYGESHCVGHQFWHFLDPHYQKLNPDFPPYVQNAMRSVYQLIDEGIGEIIQCAGSSVHVLVVASHGMGPYIGGPQLLSEVLIRLGMASGGSSGKSSWLRQLQTKISHWPRIFQPALRAIAEKGPIRRIEEITGCLLDPLQSPSTRACSLRNNRCGAIRLNLQGREPFGQLSPGIEAEKVIAELKRELYALRHPTYNEPIIENVITANEAFGVDHHPDVPDLMVAFRSDLGVLESCFSPRVGQIKVPLYHPNIPRSGDHTIESGLWIAGPGIQPGDQLNADVLDIAPTVLQLLSVPLPENLDGKPIQGIPAGSIN